MSVRSAALFAPDGKGTRLMFGQWVSKGALQPILTTMPLVDGERVATPAFRSLWAKAFPARPPLPRGPCARRDGAASDEFWFIFT